MKTHWLLVLPALILLVGPFTPSAQAGGPDPLRSAQQQEDVPAECQAISDPTERQKCIEEKRT